MIRDVSKMADPSRCDFCKEGARRSSFDAWLFLRKRYNEDRTSLTINNNEEYTTTCINTAPTATANAR